MRLDLEKVFYWKSLKGWNYPTEKAGHAARVRAGLLVKVKAGARVGVQGVVVVPSMALPLVRIALSQEVRWDQ